MRARALTPALVTVGLLAGCGSGMEATPPGDLIALGDRVEAPVLRGSLVGDGEFDPDSTDGLVTVVNFWGSWCGPCRLEVPELQDVADANPDVAVVGVDLRDQEDLALRFLQDRGITYPSIADPAGELTTAFSAFPIARTPATIVVDDTGRVAAAYVVPVSAEDLQRALDHLD